MCASCDVCASVCVCFWVNVYVNVCACMSVYVLFVKFSLGEFVTGQPLRGALQLSSQGGNCKCPCRWVRRLKEYTTHLPASWGLAFYMGAQATQMS